MEDLNHGSNKGNRAHKVILMGRKTCGLNGIVDVIAFDVNEMIMETEQGMLMIKGSELHVTRLSLEKGEVDLEGRIDSLVYSEISTPAAKTESFFSKLFR